jgi:hypothetical protein
VVLRIVLLVVLVAYGLSLVWVGMLGWRQRLSLSGRLGVRTPAALRDYETFQVANRVAGLPEMVAGGVAVLGGVAAFAVGSAVGTIVAAAIGLVGAVVIARAGGVLGTKAAAAVPEREPVGCGGGCSCGSGACGAQPA